MHISDIVISYILIYGLFGLPALGTAGAGIGTTLGTYIGTTLYFIEALKVARKNGFLKGIPQGEPLITMLRLSIPAGIQQLFFSAGMTAFFWIVGRVGTAELATSNVLLNLWLVAILIGLFLRDPATVALARLPLKMVALSMALDTVGSVLMQALLGARDSKWVMLCRLSFDGSLSTGTQNRRALQQI